MPKSVYTLFTSRYDDKLDIGDRIVCRLPAFNNQPREFEIVEIEELLEDGETVYVYRGKYVGRPKR